RGRDTGAAARDQTQTPHAAGLEAGCGHQTDEERRRADHERDVLRSIVSIASSGRHLAIKVARIGTTPGMSTAFSSPETCASGAGMRIESPGTSSWARIMARALYASPR